MQRNMLIILSFLVVHSTHFEFFEDPLHKKRLKRHLIADDNVKKQQQARGVNTLAATLVWSVLLSSA